MSDKNQKRKAKKDKDKIKKNKPPVNIRTVAAQVQQNTFKLDQFGRTLNDVGAMVEVLLNNLLVQVDHMNNVHAKAERSQKIDAHAQKIAHAKIKKLQAESEEPITQAIFMPIMEQARKQAELELYPPEQPGEPTIKNDVVDEAKRKFEEAKKDRLEKLEKEDVKLKAQEKQ